MQPLSGIDSSFLVTEGPRQPMHVGGVMVFEGSMRFDAFRDTIASRVHLVPRLQQRLVMVPFGIGKPFWVEDPEFDLDTHIQHVALPNPGNWKELRRLAGRIFSMPLDRSRPLWEMTFVEGLDEIPQVPPGSVAMIAKAHHAAIDGVSGADLLSVFLDITKEPRSFGPPPARAIPPVPNEVQVLAHTAKKVLRTPGLVKRVAGEVRDALPALAKARDKGGDAPPTAWTAPSTPLNRSISGRRLWTSSLFELDRVKAVRRAAGCTLNDVILAICAGALRRYLLERGQLPEEPLVVAVPVSTRTEEERGKMGNKISAMVVNIATNVADPVERLQLIHEHARASKAFQATGAGQVVADMSEFMPFGLATGMSRLYSRFRVADRINPMVNCIVTNVPGPQMALYLAGHKLLANMGMAPLLDGMGLLLFASTYNGVLAISSTSTPAIIPDLDHFNRLVRESGNELEAAIVPDRATVPPAGPEHEAAAELTAVFVDQLRTTLEDASTELRPAEGTFQLRVTGPPNEVWMIDLGERSVTEGNGRPADATLTIGGVDLARIVRGEIDPQMAFVQGKLRIEGDVNKAIEFGTLLPRALR